MAYGSSQARDRIQGNAATYATATVKLILNPYATVGTPR